jgi:SAM-dependent methyltransferase
MALVCKLCLAPDCVPAGRSQRRELVHCPTCGLVFVPEGQWVSVDAERERYGHHDNTAENAGYVSFLSEVADVVRKIAPMRARILDFGSGENAVLAHLLRERGYDCAAYDPVYGIGSASSGEPYDVIVVCEVIEHLRDLRGELARLRSWLAPGGRVVVRTQCYPSLEALPTWWYARDITHINFFSPAALEVAAALCGLSCAATATPDIFVWRPGATNRTG